MAGDAALEKGTLNRHPRLLELNSKLEEPRAPDCEADPGELTTGARLRLLQQGHRVQEDQG